MLTAKGEYIVRIRKQFTDLIDHYGYKYCAEVGVFRGQFSKRLLDNSKLSVLYCIDSWEQGQQRARQTAGENYQEARKVLRYYGDRVEIMKMSSMSAAQRFKPGFFDFVYLDADHEYGAVKADLFAWWPLVRSGGCFAGHDYKDQPKGGKLVKKAVDEFFCGEDNVHHTVLDGDCKSWWTIKK